MKLYIFFIVVVELYSSSISETLVKKQIDNSFITKYEYGKMLYNNPRGIGCNKCHGNDAKGKVIATFIHKTKHKIYHCKVHSYDITQISKKRFIQKLDPNLIISKPHFPKDDICDKLIYGNTMPKYFLTASEMDSIYYYITHIGTQDE